MQASDNHTASGDEASPLAAGKWLTRLGTVELLVFTIWAARTVLSGADFSALAGVFFLLPLWALVGLLATYHLIRSPGLRLRAGLYLLAPAGLILLVSGQERGASATLSGEHLALVVVLLAVFWALWRNRTRLLRGGCRGASSRPWHLTVLLLQAGLSLIWLLVTLHLGGVEQLDPWLRQDEKLALAGMLLWVGSALFCVSVALYAVLGLILPFGQSVRLMFALELLMTGVLATMLIVPGTLVFIVIMMALAG